MLSRISFSLEHSKTLSSGNGLEAIFQVWSAASLNLERSENGVLGNGLNNINVQI